MLEMWCDSESKPAGGVEERRGVEWVREREVDAGG